MGNFFEKLKEFSRPASSANHEKKIVRTITRAEFAELNRVINPKIEQNKRERLSSEIQIHNDSSVFKGLDGYDEIG